MRQCGPRTDVDQHCDQKPPIFSIPLGPYNMLPLKLHIRVREIPEFSVLGTGKYEYGKAFLKVATTTDADGYGNGKRESHGKAGTGKISFRKLQL